MQRYFSFTDLVDYPAIYSGILKFGSNEATFLSCLKSIYPMFEMGFTILLEDEEKVESTRFKGLFLEMGCNGIVVAELLGIGDVILRGLYCLNFHKDVLLFENGNNIGFIGLKSKVSVEDLVAQGVEVIGAEGFGFLAFSGIFHLPVNTTWRDLGSQLSGK